MAADRRVFVPLAHSPPPDSEDGDPYARHVEAVRTGACERARAMLRYATNPPPDLVDAIDAAALFHDLGKLDPENQAALARGRGGRLKWDHIDAGVAHLSQAQDRMAAWLVRAHHAPGLPQNAEHFDPDNLGRRLRGRRRDDDEPNRHAAQQARTDDCLRQYLADHEAVVGPHEVPDCRPTHGLTMRLALSCLVDADHADTAYFDTGHTPPNPAEPRWRERLEALRRYVRDLPVGETPEERARNQRRSLFFEACLDSREVASMVACEGPVGLGKTTAVTAYLLRRAADGEPGLRRLIIVAPYTNILTQTAKRLRKALVLPGERADQIVVEHHHRADFSEQANRDLAVLWRAPIVLTTAVSFFETLTACDPATLRKLHALPGSAVFIDEAHAALPTRLWPQNWRWVKELAESWGCRFVFASGSLARFWEDADIVAAPVTLPELLPRAQAADVLDAERRRVKYRTLANGGCLTVEELIAAVRKRCGPRLVILNTVQNAAVVARAMRQAGMRTLHLSTALCPRDRDRIMRRVEKWLKAGRRNWSLVATSCVEAGVDFSFRRAFRERFSVASEIQVGGRVNRHGEHDCRGGGIVFDFALDDRNITQHPDAEIPAAILREMLKAGEFRSLNPADLVTKAMRQESKGMPPDEQLHCKAERERNYPKVAELGRVIRDDTRLVVVDPILKKRLRLGRPVDFADLLKGSVQLWSNKIDRLGCEPIPHRGSELFLWTNSYESTFLGIMDGVLKTQDFLAQGGYVI